MNNNSMFCTYLTPCNYCSKFDKWCDKCNKNQKKLEKTAQKQTNEKLLNPAEEYAVEFAENHNISIEEAWERPMVKERLEFFNKTGI